MDHPTLVKWSMDHWSTGKWSMDHWSADKWSSGPLTTGRRTSGPWTSRSHTFIQLKVAGKVANCGNNRQRVIGPGRKFDFQENSRFHKL